MSVRFCVVVCASVLALAACGGQSSGGGSGAAADTGTGENEADGGGGGGADASTTDRTDEGGSASDATEGGPASDGATDGSSTDGGTTDGGSNDTDGASADGSVDACGSCFAPPVGTCNAADDTFTLYSAQGECEPDSGLCFYDSTDIPCPLCSKTCGVGMLSGCVGTLCNCQQSHTCDLTCNTDVCATTCYGGSDCTVDCDYASNCAGNCLAGAQCDFDCGSGKVCSFTCSANSDCSASCGSTDNCTISCLDSASCQLDCGTSPFCNFACADAGCTVAHCEQGSCFVSCVNGAPAIFDAGAKTATCGAAGSAPGNTCSAPVPLDSAVPQTVAGSTWYATNDLQVPAYSCPGTSDALGVDGRDQVYSFQPPSDGNYRFAVTGSWPADLYIGQDCAALANTCLSGVAVSYGPASIVAYLSSSETYYLVVDTDRSFYAGDYSLSIEAWQPSSCTPSCAGMACGDDGCGGQCGVCLAPSRCGPSGSCVTETAGDACTEPWLVDSVPFSANAVTVRATDDAHIDRHDCFGSTAIAGADNPDQVYAFTPAQSGNYELTLDADFQAVMYVTDGCAADTKGYCIGARTETSLTGSASFTLWMDSGITYYIYVDGYGRDESGAYHLALDAFDPGSCTPDCAGRACGPDGCGGQCGQCNDAGSQCAPTGQCDALGAGTSCALPYAAPDLDLVASGSTRFGSNNFSFGAGECPGATLGYGAGGYDHIYAFIAPSTGNYTATLTPSGFDAVIYAVSDCDAVATSCLGAAAAAGSGEPEALQLNLQKGETVYFILDGASNDSASSGSYSFVISAG